MTEKDYTNTFESPSIDIEPIFSKLGVDVPFSSPPMPNDDTPWDDLYDPVNLYWFESQMAVPLSDLRILRALFRGCDRCLQFGIGGAAALALQAGVQRVVVVDTRLDLCAEAIRQYDLRSFMDTGRLVIKHIWAGSADGAGSFVTAPTEAQIDRYLRQTSLPAGRRLLLIDGPYRLALAARAYEVATKQTTLVVSGRLKPAHRRNLSRIYRVTQSGDQIVVLKKRARRGSLAARLTEKYRSLR